MRAIDTLLADRGQLFQALFLSAPIAKALVDLDGHVLVANPMMCALTGRTAEELAGRHVDLLAHPDDPPVGDLGLEPRSGRAGARPEPAARRRAADAPVRRHGAVGGAVARGRAGTTTATPQFVVLSLVDVHRPPPRRGRPGPPRLHRPAHRPAQPPRPDRPAAARRRALPPPRAAGRAGAPEHRPVQGGQRDPRPRGRRPAAQPGRRPAALEHPRRGHRRAAGRRRVPRRRRGRRGPRRPARPGRPAAQRARRAVRGARAGDHPVGQRRADPRRRT